MLTNCGRVVKASWPTNQLLMLALQDETPSVKARIRQILRQGDKNLL